MAENGFFKNRGVPVRVAKLTKAYETSAEQVRAFPGRLSVLVSLRET